MWTMRGHRQGMDLVPALQAEGLQRLSGRADPQGLRHLLRDREDRLMARQCPRCQGTGWEKTVHAACSGTGCRKCKNGEVWAECGPCSGTGSVDA